MLVSSRTGEYPILTSFLFFSLCIRHIVAPLVTGVSGAVFKRYSSLEDAEAVFNEAFAQGRVRRIV
jgi:hypothetical protein